MFPKQDWKIEDWTQNVDNISENMLPYQQENPTDLLENIFIEHSRVESKFLSETLAKHLGREPKVEDWKKCQKMYESLHSFKFFYDYNYLGKFTRDIENKFDESLRTYVVTVTLRFEPNEPNI